MKLDVLSDPQSVAAEGATRIAAAARQAIAASGRFTLAVSGGHTPWIMLAALAKEDLPWSGIEIFQVDERVAAADSPDRNFFHLRQSLLDRVPLPPENVHAMPVESDDLPVAAVEYAATLEMVTGSPPRLDLVHLGLGPDGHTASLVPDDPVLGVTDRWVALTQPYQGHPRMTVTYPVLDNAAQILFVVTGAEKVDALAKLSRRDPSIPAGRVKAANMVVLADQAAAGRLKNG
jgi:6-phosphogluconolactonase